MKQYILNLLLVLIPLISFCQRTEVEPFIFQENISCVKTGSLTDLYIKGTNFFDYLDLKQDLIYGPAKDFIMDGMGNLSVYVGTQSVVRIPPVVNDVITTGMFPGTFAGNSTLTSITLPDTMTFLDDGNFYGCHNLTSVELSKHIANIGVSEFSQCFNLMDITIPNGVTNIGPFAFQSCLSLSTITLPDSIVSIGQNTFMACTNLHSLYFYGPAPTLNTGVFTQVTGTVYYRAGYGGSFGTNFGGLTTALWGPNLAVNNDTANFTNLTVNNNEVLTNIPSYYLTNGISYTNLTGLGPLTYSSSTGLVVDAMAQNEVIVTLTNNLSVGAPTNTAVDGRTIKWRFLATNGNWTVTWPTNTFRIPSSSSMTPAVTVSNNTISIFATEYVSSRNKWLIESYVFGY